MKATQAERYFSSTVFQFACSFWIISLVSLSCSLIVGCPLTIQSPKRMPTKRRYMTQFTCSFWIASLVYYLLAEGSCWGGGSWDGQWLRWQSWLACLFACQLNHLRVNFVLEQAGGHRGWGDYRLCTVCVLSFLLILNYLIEFNSLAEGMSGDGWKQHKSKGILAPRYFNLLVHFESSH